MASLMEPGSSKQIAKTHHSVVVFCASVRTDVPLSHAKCHSLFIIQCHISVPRKMLSHVFGGASYKRQSRLMLLNHIIFPFVGSKHFDPVFLPFANQMFRIIA